MNVLSAGRVLVVGGGDASAPISTTQIYDPTLDSWSLAGPISVPRNLRTATLPDGRILAAGGTTTGGLVATSEIYEP